MIATIRTKSEILREIDDWENKRCKNCDVPMADRKQVFCKCEAATNIRKLGEELNKTARLTNEEKIEKAWRKAEACWNAENFLLLKDFKVTDKEIRDRFGFSQSEMRQWRRKAGVADSRDKGLKK